MREAVIEEQTPRPLVIIKAASMRNLFQSPFGVSGAGCFGGLCYGEILEGFPGRVQGLLRKHPERWLGLLMAFLGFMQFINSPSVTKSFLSGAGNSLVLFSFYVLAGLFLFIGSVIYAGSAKGSRTGA